MPCNRGKIKKNPPTGVNRYGKKGKFYLCSCKSVPGPYIYAVLDKQEIKISLESVEYRKMARVCYFTGKKTRFGHSISRRGKAKYLGGVGKKVTGITNRKFKPNIQKVRAVIDGRVCRIKVSAKAIRMGLVQKPVRRNYKPAETAAS